MNEGKKAGTLVRCPQTTLDQQRGQRICPSLVYSNRPILSRVATFVRRFLTDATPDRSQVKPYLLMQKSPGSAPWSEGAGELLALAAIALDAGDVDQALGHLNVLRSELVKVSPAVHREIEARRLMGVTA